MSGYRIRVRKVAGRWRWRCHRNNRVHDLDHADTHTQALADGLSHLDMWHNDTPRRTA